MTALKTFYVILLASLAGTLLCAQSGPFPEDAVRSGFVSIMPTDLVEPYSPAVRHLWGDINGDRLKDLFLLDGRGNRLLRNLGKNGFKDITFTAFPEGAGKGVSGFFGDFDGGGALDLFLFHDEGFSLFRNEGNESFLDVTEAAGLDRSMTGCDARLEDYDGDGFLDLLVQCPGGDRIFHNRQGDGFEEISLDQEILGSTKTGLGPAPPPPNQPLSTLAMSFNVLYINDNSPGSIGIGIPEVEGGNDGMVWNDIVDGTVTGEDIMDNSILGLDIQDGSLSNLDMKNNTLTGDKIQDGTLTGADIQFNTLTGTHIVDGTLTGTDIQAGSLGSSQIQDGSLTGADIQDGSLQSPDLASNAVTGAKVLDASLTGADLQDASVGPGKITGYAATLSGSQNFDSGTLYIDAGNNKVGVGTTAPYAKLEVYSTDPYAVYGINNAGGIGLVGYGDEGVYGTTSASGGDGIQGYASSTTGPAFGVFGISRSENGYGVVGYSEVPTGSTAGVYGINDSEYGMGVYGYATSTSLYTNTYGVNGRSDAKHGKGVFGYCSSTYGDAQGVRGECDAELGSGVLGLNNRTTGTVYGVSGYCSSPSGQAVRGVSYATSGLNYGVYGLCNSPGGYGVYGQTYSGSNGCGILGESIDRGVQGISWGSGTGVVGSCGGSSGNGVVGIATSLSGPAWGVWGQTLSSSGYGIYSTGNLGCSGTKYFVQPHPSDPSKEIRFACLEGNESGTYFRGSSELQRGQAVIQVPEEFRLASEQEGITVQVTPMGPVRIWVESKSLEQIVIAGEADVEFDFFVNGVRRGYSEFKPIQENTGWIPRTRGEPYGTQFPEAVRMILVENGILNPDYTPNEATAARLGWRLEEKEVRTCPLPEEGQKAIPLQSAVQAEDEKEVKDTMAVLKAKAAFRAGLEKRH